MKTKQLEQVIDDALAHVESMIAASLGDESRCATFSTTFAHDDPFTDRQKEQVRIYLSSWIEAPLRAALVLAREDERKVGYLEWRITSYIEHLRDRSRFGRRLDETDNLAATIKEAF